MPRVNPVPTGEWDEKQTDVLGRLVQDGRLLNIFGTLGHHPDLLRRWTVFANHVLFKSTLPARDREILILRIGWLCRSEYEWGQHVVIGKAAGISADEIKQIAEGPDNRAWAPFDAALVRAADELHADAKVSDATWAALGERYDTRQLMDVVFAVGQYNLVSMALNSLGVELDPGVPSFVETAGRDPRA